MKKRLHKKLHVDEFQQFDCDVTWEESSNHMDNDELLEKSLISRLSIKTEIEMSDSTFTMNQIEKTWDMVGGKRYSFPNDPFIREATVYWIPPYQFDCITITFELSPAPEQELNEDACKVCGDSGEWRAMALVCTQGHGVILG